MMLHQELPKTLKDNYLYKMESSNECLLKSLLKFYKIPFNINTLYQISNQKTKISLRLLDWFPTNYAKNKNVYINNRNVYSNYKNQLKGYQKKFFDPFCRNERVFLKFNLDSIDNTKAIDYTYEFIGDDEDKIKEFSQRTDGFTTTVAQLNFFKWGIEENIIEYVFNNISDIDDDMHKKLANRKKNGKCNKRSTNSSVRTTVMKVVVKFN
jgi:hypothetical protein